MRASISLGLAGCVVSGAAFLMFPHGLIVSFPIAGLVASLLICQGVKSAVQRLAAGGLAAASFGLTGLTVGFSLISLQADVEPLWGAFAWGFGFGVAGAVSGRSLSRLWHRDSQGAAEIPFAGFIAGLAFAMSGAAAGFLAFMGFASGNINVLVFCIWLAFQFSGLLCEIGCHLALKRTWH